MYSFQFFLHQKNKLRLREERLSVATPLEGRACDDTNMKDRERKSSTRRSGSSWKELCNMIANMSLFPGARKKGKKKLQLIKLVATFELVARLASPSPFLLFFSCSSHFCCFCCSFLSLSLLLILLLLLFFFVPSPLSLSVSASPLQLLLHPHLEEGKTCWERKAPEPHPTPFLS